MAGKQAGGKERTRKPCQWARQGATGDLKKDWAGDGRETGLQRRVGEHSWALRGIRDIKQVYRWRWKDGSGHGKYLQDTQLEMPSKLEALWTWPPGDKLQPELYIQKA